MFLSSLTNSFNAGAWTFRDFLAFASLVLLWAVENFFIQESAFVVHPATRNPNVYRFLRMVLNLTTATALLLLCGRRLLIGVLVADSTLSVLILAHNKYFRHAFSVYLGLRMAKEGMPMTLIGLQFVPLTACLLLFWALATKIFLAFCLAPMPAEVASLGSRVAWAGVCLVPAVLIVLALQWTSFCFRSIAATRVTRAVYAYGYFISWIAEFFVVPSTHELAQELAQLQNDSPDRLSGTEGPLEFGSNVVVIQMESWGWNALDCQMNGQEVTPFLNGLARRSRLFKVEAYHHVASLDMDYAVLSGGSPSKRMVSYLVADVPYDKALPRFMQQHGFRTLALHGNSGEFFGRRENFKRMGFDEIYFQEDFNSRAVKRSYWGVRDAELFRLSSQKLHKAVGPEFHFIITLDSHVPFDLIYEEEKEIYPHSQAWQENYFNSIRVLDRDMREYIESLPAGTLVILYGDHTSNLNYAKFQAAIDEHAEYVPCVVHVCQAPAAQSAQTSERVLPEDLRILDVMNWVRHQIAERNGK
jgi:hypothetical protein